MIIYFFLSGFFANMLLMVILFSNCESAVFNVLKYGEEYCLENFKS